MKKFLFLVLIFSGLNYSFGQTLKFSVDNLDDSSVVLISLSGEKFSVIRSIDTKSKGKFEFDLDNNHPGIYRLGFSNNKSIDFIYDDEEVEIETDALNILGSIKVIQSESNKIYYNFIKLNKDYKTKSELLQLILARYPSDDDFYQTTKEELIQIQEEYLYFVNSTAQANPNSFIARYVRSSQLPVIDPETELVKQLVYLKSHALDNINFYDAELIYSDVFTNKSIEYLSYYRNPQLPLEQLEKEFESAIDSILNKAKVNEVVYKHIVEYLLDGFKKFDFDNVINYIVENYVIKDELCLDSQLTSTLERRIEQSKYFKPGITVPDINLSDEAGKLISLKDIRADRTLIIFYASWCPHCKDLLPKIYELYKKQTHKNFEVLAVSIDTMQTEWKRFVETNNLAWINVNDPIGWDGKSSGDYKIFATPTMFLVDKEFKLISKPTEFEELTKLL
ncbi:MAG: TlpA family protein disulfide reductase [Ignavibacteriales bacterium]|nr:MAG: TlpA family protein disulfide reductase [Ignavibacteriales bacterium]